MLCYIRSRTDETGFGFFPETPVLSPSSLPSSLSPLLSAGSRCGPRDGTTPQQGAGTPAPQRRASARIDSFLNSRHLSQLRFPYATNILPSRLSSAGNCGWFLLGDTGEFQCRKGSSYQSIWETCSPSMKGNCKVKVPLGNQQECLWETQPVEQHFKILNS